MHQFRQTKTKLSKAIYLTALCIRKAFSQMAVEQEAGTVLHLCNIRSSIQDSLKMSVQLTMPTSAVNYLTFL